MEETWEEEHEQEERNKMDTKKGSPYHRSTREQNTHLRDSKSMTYLNTQLHIDPSK